MEKQREVSFKDLIKPVSDKVRADLIKAEKRSFSVKQKGGKMKELGKEKTGNKGKLILDKPEYDRIVIKVRGARLIVYKQWNEKTHEEFYDYVKIDDVVICHKK